MQELTAEQVDPTPTLWVQCDCGIPYVLRRGYSLSKGQMWFWQQDCKHPKKEAHTAEMWTAEGRYGPETI